MADQVDNLATEMTGSLKINGDSNMNEAGDTCNGSGSSKSLAGEEIYRLALRFYKEKEGKAMHLSYADKLKFVALTKQVAHGKCRPDASTDVGFLDVVGNDRRQAWQALGDLSKEEAMNEFVERLDRVCPLFSAYLEAHKAEKEEMERKKREEEEKLRAEAQEEERRRLEQDALEQQEKERQKQLQQELHIRSALNQQTSVQFQQYAQQQFPNNPQQQEVLIGQLQEQHFQQYMQQVYQQQLLHQQQQFQQISTMNGGAINPTPLPPQPAQNGGEQFSVTSEVGTEAAGSSNNRVVEGTAVEGYSSGNNNMATATALLPSNQATADDADDQETTATAATSSSLELPIAAPSMWTRKDSKQFKESLGKDADSVIRVGSGETVTVRVPTHEDGTCLFWEFATDSYDIGFGVYFEWTIAPNNQVSVHVSESSDEEELDEEDGEGGATNKGDVEKGGGAAGSEASSKKADDGPPTDEIIPVYRRDCHEEVYCGSHMYPGQGVYLLKFDNSYSLWRSKTLYYRVYYTR